MVCDDGGGVFNVRTTLLLSSDSLNRVCYGVFTQHNDRTPSMDIGSPVHRYIVTLWYVVYYARTNWRVRVLLNQTRGRGATATEFYVWFKAVGLFFFVFYYFRRNTTKPYAFGCLFFVAIRAYVRAGVDVPLRKIVWKCVGKLGIFFRSNGVKKKKKHSERLDAVRLGGA